jgi:hypothetical protein
MPRSMVGLLFAVSAAMSPLARLWPAGTDV